MDPTTARQAALSRLATLTTIERGTLREEYRPAPAAADKKRPPRGPYFKHQCWEHGKNRSVRVPPAQVAQLRQDLEHGRLFDQLTAELAELAIAQSRTARAALGTGPGSKAPRIKKNSTRNASRSATAKPKASSPPCARRSARER